MAPAETHTSRTGRRRDQDDDGPGDLDRRGHRDRPRERRYSRDRRSSSRSRRRSRTPESSHRRHHRQRDHDRERERERGRGRGRDESPGRRRDRERSSGRHQRQHGSRHLLPSTDINADGDAPAQQKSVTKHRGPLPSQQDSFAVDNGQEPAEKPKEKPNWGNTGALAAASNSVVQADGTSTTLKYHEPVEARKPSSRHQWKLFVFKDGDIVDTIELSPKSCWLVGRDSGVADILAEHPSISKQHAVIQFRYMEKRNEFGEKIGRVKPYLLDLESANGTVLNDDAVPQSRYLELRHKDMMLFGNSTREYVVMLAPRD